MQFDYGSHFRVLIFLVLRKLIFNTVNNTCVHTRNKSHFEVCVLWLCIRCAICVCHHDLQGMFIRGLRNLFCGDGVFWTRLLLELCFLWALITYIFLKKCLINLFFHLFQVIYRCENCKGYIISKKKKRGGEISQLFLNTSWRRIVRPSSFVLSLPRLKCAVGEEYSNTIVILRKYVVKFNCDKCIYE